MRKRCTRSMHYISHNLEYFLLAFRLYISVVSCMSLQVDLLIKNADVHDVHDDDDDDDDMFSFMLF